MFVVTLKSRFDNATDNLPLFAGTSMREAEEFIDRQVDKDCRLKFVIKEYFNGGWTAEEIADSFRNDYRIYEVQTDKGKENAK